MTESSPAVVVLATAWGTRHGGINSFSTDLSLALARVLPTHRIVSVVFEASEAEKREAAVGRVDLVSLHRAKDETAASEWAAQVLGVLRSAGISSFPWWIGHDIFTGPLALSCANESGGARAAVIMHMSYEDYAYVKYGPEEARTVAERARQQRTVVAAATVAFAVGPLLHERLCGIRGRDHCEQLVPGLFDKAPALESARLQAITYGRFDAGGSLIKQAPLAVAGFARAVREAHQTSQKTLQDASLTVIGAPTSAARQLVDLGEKTAGRVINLQVLDYLEDRTKLKELLWHSNLCLMLSWHEGFGLAGWEAIGAGIPLIVSKKSGVFQLLDSIGGAAVGCVKVLDVLGRGDGEPRDADVDATSKLILEVAADIPKARANAESLRTLLRFQRHYTWDSTATRLCAALGLSPEPGMLRTIGSAVSPVASPDVIEGLDVAAVHRALELATTYYHNGEYAEALSALEPAKRTAREKHLPASTVIDATLTECDILLRLNQYTRARALLSTAASEAADRQDWRRYIRARAIENVILRDTGQYSEAVTLARELLTLAERQCVEEVEGAHRKLGRSLALYGRWDEALKHGNAALEVSRAHQDHESEAKALLVIGEAYRHGLNQSEAMSAYSRGRDLSGLAGNVDCYLWCVLGLADSLFLLGEYQKSKHALEEIAAYMKRSTQPYPLESLHLDLSLLSVEHAEGRPDADALQALIGKYLEFGVEWPRDYGLSLRSADFSHPKRF